MKLTIIGASGHGRVIADIAKLNGYEAIEFLDDNEKLTLCGKYPVVGKSSNAVDIQNDLVIGIGNATIRKCLMEQLEGKSFPTLIHPNAVIADDVTIDKGTVVMAGAVINPGVVIGKGVIVNTCSSVDHDCNIADYAHVSVGTHLCGTVNVGESAWIGAGATVSNNLNICSNCKIGAGAVVVKDIFESGTYVGVPARRIK